MIELDWDAREEDTITERPAAGARVLVAADDDETRFVVSLAFAVEGYEVLDVSSASELLQALESIAIDGSPWSGVDLVVLDLRADGATGFDAMRMLRAASAATPIVLIDGGHAPHDSAEAARLGVPVLPRPLDVEILTKTALGLLVRDVGATELGVSTPPPARDRRQRPRQPHVLVAEDDEGMRRLVSDALRKDGCEVREAADGRELFWLTERARCEQPFDVIITDLRMPAYNGLDVAEAWAANGTPEEVVLMSAFPDPDVRRRAAKIGAALLDKPFRIAQLRDLVRRLTQDRVPR